jgi:hypothetical protein
MTNTVENLENILLQNTLTYGIGIMVMGLSEEGVTCRVVPVDEYMAFGQALVNNAPLMKNAPKETQ